MRVFPTWGITAPRLPLEESYSFFICPSFLACWFPNRDNANIVVPICPDHNHQGAERIRAQGHEALLSLTQTIFNSERPRDAQNTIPPDKGDAVLLDIRGVFLGIESCCH